MESNNFKDTQRRLVNSALALAALILTSTALYHCLPDKEIRTKPTNPYIIIPKYDTNKDGVITRDEIRQFYHKNH